MSKIVILTGAGISAESGLGTFRDEGGLWAQHRIEDVATPEGFARNPQLVHDFYNARRVQAAEEEYLAVYENSEADEDLRAQSLYQLALINLSPYNQQADRLTALNYLRQLSEEFPESKIRPMADIRIAALLTAR